MREGERDYEIEFVLEIEGINRFFCNMIGKVEPYLFYI